MCHSISSLLSPLNTWVGLPLDEILTCAVNMQQYVYLDCYFLPLCLLRPWSSNIKQDYIFDFFKL